jgi:hypothetical protein
MVNLYKPKPITAKMGDSEAYLKQYAENFARLRECDRLAKEAGQLVGRYIEHPFADGAAVYQVVREYKKTVVIQVCSGLGDDWVLPAWGARATVDKDLVLGFIKRRESLEELFKPKGRG